MLIRNFLLITLEFALKLSVDFGRPFASLLFILSIASTAAILNNY